MEAGPPPFPWGKAGGEPSGLKSSDEIKDRQKLFGSQKLDHKKTQKQLLVLKMMISQVVMFNDFLYVYPGFGEDSHVD